VLLAVAEQIESGELSWDDEVTVTEELRSLPSGELQDEPAGTAVSVREAALKMISISDNTATDLLIDRVGRERVEEAVADAGHHDPAAMRPFPTTRDLFALGWGDPADRESWIEGGEEERRALLDEIAGEPLDVSASDLTDEPVWDEGIDWFASARDIASVHGALHGLDDGEIRDILSENPGVAIEDWPYAAFKGGGSVGVLTGSWLVEAADGSTATIVVQAAADDAEEAAALTTSQQELFGLAQSAMRLLAE
jgi:hypothetical protein